MPRYSKHSSKFKISNEQLLMETLERIYGLSPQECYDILEAVGRDRTELPSATLDGLSVISEVRGISFVYHPLKRRYVDQAALTGIYNDKVFTFLVTNEELKQISTKPKRNRARSFYIFKPGSRYARENCYNYKTKKFKLK